MKTKPLKIQMDTAEYYDSHGVLKDIVDEDIDLSLNDALKKDIVSGKRKRNLKNISIKMDPLYIQSIKKIATMRNMPYQTLVREWLSEKIKKELKIA